MVEVVWKHWKNCFANKNKLWSEICRQKTRCEFTDSCYIKEITADKDIPKKLFTRQVYSTTQEILYNNTLGWYSLLGRYEYY